MQSWMFWLMLFCSTRCRSLESAWTCRYAPLSSSFPSPRSPSWTWCPGADSLGSWGIAAGSQLSSLAGSRTSQPRWQFWIYSAGLGEWFEVRSLPVILAGGIRWRVLRVNHLSELILSVLGSLLKNLPSQLLSLDDIFLLLRSLIF